MSASLVPLSTISAVASLAQGSSPTTKLAQKDCDARWTVKYSKAKPRDLRKAALKSAIHPGVRQRMPLNATRDPQELCDCQRPDDK